MPFERVLVPLDGSRLAEAGLSAAKPLSRRLGSVLVLAHVVEDDPPEQVHGDLHLTSREAAEAYLEQQRELCVAEGLRAEMHVSTPQSPDVPRVIVELAAELNTDLVAMCAHGRQSLADRFLGPIAQRVMRGGGPPIMLRTSGSPSAIPVELRHILLPVDFRHDVSIAVADVVILARGFGARVTLLHAVDAGATGLPARMLPNTSFELSDRAREAARRRLSRLVQHLEEQGVEADAVVSSKDPEDAIIDEAKERKTDLIVLISHARSGVTAWYERSVGQRMIQEPDLNLLLLRGSAAAEDN